MCPFLGPHAVSLSPHQFLQLLTAKKTTHLAAFTWVHPIVEAWCFIIADLARRALHLASARSHAAQPLTAPSGPPHPGQGSECLCLNRGRQRLALGGLRPLLGWQGRCGVRTLPSKHGAGGCGRHIHIWRQVLLLLRLRPHAPGRAFLLYADITGKPGAGLWVQRRHVNEVWRATNIHWRGRVAGSYLAGISSGIGQARIQGQEARVWAIAGATPHCCRWTVPVSRWRQFCPATNPPLSPAGHVWSPQMLWWERLMWKSLFSPWRTGDQQPQCVGTVMRWSCPRVTRRTLPWRRHAGPWLSWRRGSQECSSDAWTYKKNNGSEVIRNGTRGTTGRMKEYKHTKQTVTNGTVNISSNGKKSLHMVLPSFPFHTLSTVP